MHNGATLEPRNVDPARLAEILEASDVGLWEFEHISETARWSPQLEAMLGRRAQTLRDIPEGWLGLIHPEDRPHVEAAIEAALGSDNPLFDQQFRMQHQNGRWRWLHTRGRVIERDPVTGVALCTAGTVADITNAKEVEHQLAERERRLSLITETISEVFWMADVAIERIEYASPAYEQIWQRPVAELYARPKSFLEAVHPEDAENVARAFLDKDRARPFDHEYRIVRPDGSVRWIWDRGFPVKDPAGKATHYVGIAQDITDRKAAEDEIRRLNEQLLGHVNDTAAALAQSQLAHHESEERFRYAMEASQVGLWSWDLVFGTVSFDAAHAATLDLPHSGRHPVWADVVHADDQPALAAAARQLRQDGHCEIEYRLRLPDGSERWVLSRGKVVKRGPASEPMLALGTHTDIDGLKRAEAQRRRLAAIVEAAGDLIAIATPTGKVEYMNNAGRALLGIGPDASLANARIEQHHPDWAARRILNEGLPAAYRLGQWLGETAILRPDGSEVPVSQLIIAQRSSETGEVESYSTICRDLRDRKEIESALREREQMLQAVLDNFPFRVWLKDCDSRYLAVNSVFARTCGWPSPESLIGRNDLDVTSADLAASYGADDRRVLATGTAKQTEELGETGGQRRWFETYKSPVLVDGRVIGTVGFARDISDRKAAEVALRESEAQLRAILEQLPVGVGVLDRQGVFALGNAVMHRFVGATLPSRDAQQIPRWSARDAAGNPIPPSQWPGECALRGEALSPGMDFTYRRGDGDERIVLVSAVPFRNSQGELVGAISVVQDITELKRAEAKVGESEALLKAVLDGSPDPIYLKDRGNRLLLANPAALAVIGKPAADCLSKTDEQLYDNPADGRAIMTNDQRIMASGQPETVEEVVNTASGPRYYVSKKAPYRDGAGNIVGLIGNARDITERKQAENKLRESEARFKAVLDGSLDPIFLKDREGRLLLANPVTFAAVGKPPEVCLGKTAEQFHDNPAEGSAIMEIDLRIMASGRTEAVEEVVTTPSGLRCFLSIKTPWRDAFGNIIGLIGTSRDITEGKQAEQKLRESEARFRGTFEQAAVGIAHIDPEGRWLRVNRKFCSISGYRHEELMGLSVGDLTGSQECTAHRQRAARLLAREIEAFTIERRYRRKSGEPIWVAVTASLVWQENGGSDYFVAVIEDITARKATESALQQARDTLEQRVIERTADAEARAQALHESERFARATVDALAAHLCVLDEQGNILATNRAWDEFAVENGAWTSSVGKGANYLAVCDAAATGEPPDKAAALVARRLRAMLAGRRTALALEYECHAPHQQRWFAVKASRFAGPGPVRLLVLHENVSAQKLSARAREEGARELSRLTAHLASVREEEGRRIAGQVHDELGGTLTILKLGLGMLTETPSDPDALPARVGAMIEQADGAIQAVRRIAAGLHPPMLDALGLSATIRWQAGEFSRQTGIQTVVEIPETIDLPPDRGIAVYRIIQEALTNVVRHANATQVHISIQAPNRHLALEVRDNGKGFDSAKDRRTRSFGVVGMRERAQHLGGQLSVASTPGEGTTVRLRLPLDWGGSAQ